MNTVLEFENASLFRQGEFVFKNLNWVHNRNEHWVITGETGAGKTSLLQAIAGTLHLKEGAIRYPFLQDDIARWQLKNSITLVSFTGKLVTGSDNYYQQRYNLSTEDDLPTVRTYLNHADVTSLSTVLQIQPLLDVELIKLSNGQTRRVQLAKALAANPAMLLLDNPFAGLDEEGRKTFRTIISNLLQQGHHIILTCNHEEDVPEGFTHVLKLEQQKIVFKGSLKDYPKTEAYQTNILQLPKSTRTQPDFEIAVQFNNVSVQYNDQYILKDVSFKILKNEKWAVLGPNGSGKSTLLSLINADHPQAYANTILLFDEPKSQQSIWQIKKRIGYFSAELHAYFHEDLTVKDVLATGLSGTLVPQRQLSDQAEARMHALLSYYNKVHVLNKWYIHLSAGEQRLILFLRALMIDHDLLILDEPFQGFDQNLIYQSRNLIDQFCHDKTLLFVSHYRAELPASVKQFIELKEGSIAAIGTIS